MENNTNLVRVRRTELKYLQWFSDCVFLGRISAPMWTKVFSQIQWGEIPISVVIKFFVKNWLIKAFSNEIKSQTFSCLWPGFYLFWLTKRNTTHKIPGMGRLICLLDCDKTSEKRKWKSVVFGINIYLNKFNIKF